MGACPRHYYTGYDDQSVFISWTMVPRKVWHHWSKSPMVAFVHQFGKPSLHVYLEQISSVEKGCSMLTLLTTVVIDWLIYWFISKFEIQRTKTQGKKIIALKKYQKLMMMIRLAFLSTRLQLEADLFHFRSPHSLTTNYRRLLLTADKKRES